MTASEILARWRDRREEWGRFDSRVDGSRLCDEVLADLEAIQKIGQGELLDLHEAALHSGYSREHLGRLIREGKIPNAGTKGAPRIVRGDLPRKPARPLAHTRPHAYDPVADARKLGGRRRGGSHAS